MDTTQLSIILSAQDKASAIISGITGVLQNLGLISDDSAKKLNNLGDSSAGSADKLKLVGAIAAAAVATGIAAIGYESIKSAANFQSATSTLVTSAGVQQDQIGKVRNDILQLSTATGTGADQITQAWYKASSAGYSTAQSYQIVKAAAQGAKAENADLAQVTDAVTSAMRDYHEPAGDAADVTSKLVEAVASGKSTFADLTGSLHSVLPIASAMHVPLSNILGDLASITVHGESADQATQNMAEAMRTLQSPSQSAQQYLASIGISASNLSGDLGSQKGLSGTLQEISDAIMNHMGPSGKVLISSMNQSKAAAADLNTMISALPAGMQATAKAYENGTTSYADFMKQAKSTGGATSAMLQQFLAASKNAQGFNSLLKSGSPEALSYSQALQKATGNATTMSVALMLTGENSEYTNKAVRDVSAATAEAGNNVKGWAFIQGNMNQQLSEAKNAIHNTGIALGSAFLPPLTKVLGVITKILTPIAEWVEKNGKLAAIILTVAGGIAALTATILTVSLAFNKIKEAALIIHLIKDEQEGWTIATKLGAAAQAVFNAVMAANPILLIVLAIVAFIAILVLLIVKVKPVRDFFADLWRDLKQWFEDGINFIKSHWELLPIIFLGPLGIIVDLVIKHFTAIKNFITTVISDIWHIIADVLGVIEKIFEYTFLIILGITVEIFKAIWDAIRIPVEAIASVITTVFTAIYTFYKAIFTAIYNTIVTIVTTIYNFLVSIFTAIYNFLSGIWNKLLTFIDGIASAIYNVVASIFGKVLSVVISIFTAVWNFVVSIWNKVYQAVSSAIGDVLAIVGTIMGKILAVFADAGSWLLDAGKNIVEGLVKGIAGAAGDAAKAAENVAKGAINAAKSFLGIHSPSTVFAEVGDFSMQGLQQGITANKQNVVAATQDVAAATVTGAKSAIVTAQAQQNASGGIPNTGTGATASQTGSTTINLTVKIGLYAGTTTEQNQVATVIWQALNRIANSHNLSFPQIGILPN
jgi:TP901 family phage tail tape measure protein